MSKTFHIEYGSHTNPLAHGETFKKRRKDAEQIRSWWVDNLSPENIPGDRWAVIHKVRL